MIMEELYNTDCIAGMSLIPDGAVDLILTDLPYGVTDCYWDSLLPMDQLWEQYWRVLKPNGAAVLTCCQPFTTTLIQSQRKYFRYCWYWRKNQPTGFPFAKVQPMRTVEDIAVFYRKKPTYNPQGLIRLEKPVCKNRKTKHNEVYQKIRGTVKPTEFANYPRNLLEFNCERGLHPTQKPVALMEYLIRTYTNPGETVLDSCMGSGTTKTVARNAGRNFIGFEIDKDYFEIAKNR